MADVTALLAEAEWLQRLARSLVGRDDADDIVQETFAAALHTPPDPDRPARPWLRRVLVNVVRMRHRGRVRRDAREQALELAEPVRTPEQLLERARVERTLADLVIALAEPLRSTVLLRYREGLSAEAIAAEQQISVATVRRRLSEAVEQLRTEMDVRETSTWRAAFAPFLVPRGKPAPIWRLLMAKLGTKIAIIAIAALLLLVGGGLVVHRRHASTEGTPGSVATSGLHAPAGARAAPLVVAFALGARHIAGRVEAAGKPIAGATVRLGALPFLYDQSMEEPIATARTGADGRFDLGEYARGAFLISAEAPSFTPAALRVDAAAAPDRLVLALGSCTSRLVGIVRDARGGPIGGARLSSYGLAGVDAAADGSFALCLGRNSTSIRVAADGYGAVGFSVAIGGELHRDVVLVPEAILSGDVVDEARNPVANARIFAVVDSNGRGDADGSATSDASGAFRLARLAPGRYRLSATTESGLGARVPLIVVATTGAIAAPIHLVLAPRARVSGKVVDGSGLAVAGARISIDDRFDASAFAISQLDGSFTLVGVPLGPIALAAAPYEVRAPHRLIVDRLVMEGVKLDVTAGRTLRGVVTRHGAAVAGAEVTCDSDPVTTDATGNYVLGGALGRSDHRLGLQCNLRATVDRATSAGQSVALAAGETRIVDIDLASSASIAGTVVDATGAPVPAVEIVARRPEHPSDLCTTMTGAAGDFDCTGLAGAADYEIDVYPGPGTRSFAPATGEHLPLVHLDGGDATAHVTLAIASDRLAIRGTVVDDTGAPIADAFVQANVGEITYGAPTPSTRTDDTGGFALDNLGSGAYRVHVKVADGGEATSLGVAAGTPDLVLHVARAGAISGDLVGFTTPPSVTTHESSAGGDTSGFPLVDGSTFSLTGLQPGTYRLEAWDDTANVEADTATVVVRAGTTSHVTLRERGQGRISARVVDSVTHAPIAGLPCHVAAASDGNIGCCYWLFETPPVLSDLQGHLTMPAPAGAARVFCMPSLEPPFPPDAPYSWASADVQVPTNGTGYAEIVAVPRSYPRSEVGFFTANFLEPPQVIRVEPGSPAAASGLAIGDIVTTIDGAAVTGLAPNAVLTLATNHRPGTLLSVGTLRGTFTFVVGAAPLP
jgi:RNA polymerase sigma factor (sigma-70 family)